MKLSSKVLLLILAVVLGGLAVTGDARAEAPAPVAASPGDAKRLTTVAASCPTFSWGLLPGASAYELVAYRLATDAGLDNGEATVGPPAIHQIVPGAALSWTPPLGRCLERGRTYAWVVRALSGRKPGNWSSPLAFRVATAPSEQEVEDALTVLRRYLDEAGVSVGGKELSGPRVSGVDRTLSRKLSAVSMSSTSGSGPPPPPPPSNVFFVDGTGSVYGESFTGDGRGLTGVDAERLGGLPPSSYADGTHIHQTQKFTCTGPAGTSSACVTAPCPPSFTGYPFLTGGGCSGSATTCTGGWLITKSQPSGDAWECEIECRDGSGDVTASGTSLCQYYMPW